MTTKQVIEALQDIADNTYDDYAIRAINELINKLND